MALSGYAKHRKKYVQGFDDGDVYFDDLEGRELEAVAELAGGSAYPVYNDFDISDVMTQYFIDGRGIPSEAAPPPSLRRDSKTYITSPLPPKGILTFKLGTPTIDLHPSTPHQKLFLENTSLEDVRFVLQLSNPFFTVVPAYGIVEKSSTLAVRVMVRRNFLKVAGAVKGYLYVRTHTGFPVERLAVSGYNLPAIKVSSMVLEFGRAPTGEVRSATICLTNVVQVDCAVVMIMVASEASSIFQLPQAQVVVPANDSKYVTIKCTFSKPGPVSEEVIFAAFGGQIIKVRLVGYCGRAMQVLEESLNFGPTDIFYDGVTKGLTIVNLDHTRTLAVAANFSSLEFVFNHGRELVLDAGETRTIPVKFVSNMSGKRHERLSLYAPNSLATTIEMLAISGPYLKIPIQEDIYMVACVLGATSFVRVPVTNLTPDAIVFTVCVPVDFPVKLEELPFSHCNTGNKGEFTVKTYTSTDWTGLKITLPGLSTCLIEVAFTSPKSGQFKIPLRTFMSLPVKLETSSHFIYCSVYTEDILFKLLQEDLEPNPFYTKPYLVPTSIPLNFEPVEVPSTRKPKPDVFRIDPAVQTIFGALSSGRPFSDIDYINLTNLSDEPQKYRLIPSYHFKTSLVLEGVLPPFSTLHIPIRFDPTFFVNTESKGFTALGGITVLALDFKDPGMVASQLLGIVDDLLALELRDLSLPLKFVDVSVLESSKRTLTLRNKTSAPLFIDLIPDDPSFTVVTRSVTLKPYECVGCEVGFRTSTYGEFKGRISVAYMHGENRKIVGPVSLIACAGSPSITTTPDFLVFGDIEPEEIAEQVLSIHNTAQMKAVFGADTAGVVKTRGNIVVPRGKGIYELPVWFHPRKNMHLSYPFSFAVGTKTHSISLIGNSAIFKFTTNLAKPSLYIEGEGAEKESIWEADAMAFGEEKKIELILFNGGDSDFTVVGMETLDDRILGLEPVFESFVGTSEEAVSLSFGAKNLDVNEIDLDNFGHVIEATKQPQRPNRSRTSQFFKSRSSSVVSLDRRASKLFGRGMEVPIGPAFGGHPMTDLLPMRVRPYQNFRVTMKIKADVLVYYQFNLGM